MDETGPDVPWTPASYARQNSWPTSGDTLWLLTPMELEVTPKGTILTSIMDNKKIVGHDYIDTDTRAGYLAYGMFDYQFKH
jgi:hypothetical protein